MTRGLHPWDPRHLCPATIKGLPGFFFVLFLVPFVQQPVLEESWDARAPMAPSGAAADAISLSSWPSLQ